MVEECSRSEYASVSGIWLMIAWNGREMVVAGQAFAVEL
jgi:hypothetical protein